MFQLDNSSDHTGLIKEFSNQASAGIQGKHTISTQISEMVSEVVALLSAHRYIEAEYRLYSAFDNFSHEQFLLEILLPIEIQIGDLWHRNTVNVFTEHAATAFLRQQLDKLLASLLVPLDAPLVLCACGPGEFHELGMLSLVYFLRSAKLNALYLGANLPAGDLMIAIETLKPAAVCLAATISSTALKLIYMLYQLSEKKREEPLVIGYGGRFFNFLPETQRAMLPGLYLGEDAKIGSKVILDNLGLQAKKQV
ncbi:MAG: hypothetical protein WCS37_15105 [Chloroflexota bacterium]